MATAYWTVRNAAVHDDATDARSRVLSCRTSARHACRETCIPDGSGAAGDGGRERGVGARLDRGQHVRYGSEQLGCWQDVPYPADGVRHGHGCGCAWCVAWGHVPQQLAVDVRG